MNFLKPALLLVTLFHFSLAQVTCDKFDVIWTFDGKMLNISIDTDLPDDTKISVSAKKTYVLKENGETYGVDYLSSKNSAVEWKNQHTFEIDEKEWQKKLKVDLKQKAAFQMGTTASSINDIIEVRVLVAAGQSNPTFGRWNANLSGSKVKKGDLVSTVEFEFMLETETSTAAETPAYANPGSLIKGKTYTISKRTPLMSKFNPSRIEQAIRKSVWLEEGSSITVLEVSKKGNTPWYQVNAVTKTGVSINNGWINSKALIGQTISIVE